jgi:hypothetical protein
MNRWEGWGEGVAHNWEGGEGDHSVQMREKI